VASEPDHVSLYARSAGLAIADRTIFVEGSTDVEYLKLAVRLEHEANGTDLLRGPIAVVASGLGDEGGANALARQLSNFRQMAQTALLPNGRPRYRFIGLLDNDAVGQRTLRELLNFDRSTLEYRDVFRLRPNFPFGQSRDPYVVARSFDTANATCKGLQWEIEDLLGPDLLSCFFDEEPYAIAKTPKSEGGWTHRDLTPDGKAKLLRFVRANALRKDVDGLVRLMEAMRYYAGLP
jgi:hypothetical protein